MAVLSTLKHHGSYDRTCLIYDNLCLYITNLLTAILNLTQDIFMKNFADISFKNWLSWKHVKKREKKLKT